MAEWQRNLRPSCKPEFLMRQEGEGAVVFNKSTASALWLTKEEFDIVRLLNGRQTVEEIGLALGFLEAQGQEQATVTSHVIQVVESLYWLGLLRGWDSANISAPATLARQERVVRSSQFPLMILWSITKRCNLACRHCYMDAGVKSDDELSGAQKAAIASEIDRQGAFMITLTGGEPLLSPDLFDIAVELRKSNQQRVLALETNGFLVDDKMARQIASHFSLVQMSIYGATDVEHDAFAGKVGAFARVWEATSALRELRVGVVHNFICSKSRPESPLLYLDRYASQVDAVKITPLEPIGRGVALKKECIDERELVSLVTQVAHLRKKYPHVGMHMPYLAILSGTQRYCGAGRTQCFVSCTGDVYPCERITLQCGNVKEESLSTVWANSRILHAIRSRSPLNGGHCDGCSQFPDCGGGCLAYDGFTVDSGLVSDPVCAEIRGLP